MAVDQALLEQELRNQNLITEKKLTSLIAYAKTQNISLEDLIFEREIVPQDKFGAIIAQLYNIPFIKVSDRIIPESVLRIVPHTLALSQLIIPFEEAGGVIKVALNNPKNYELISFIEKKTSLGVEPYYATKKDIQFSLKAYSKNINKKFNKLLKGALEDPTKIDSLKDVTKLLDAIILFAFQTNASDIHIEAHKDFVSIRYRIDGILQTIAELPITILELLSTRVKVLSNLRTDEHRSFQDGRFKVDLENNEITLRVSIVPTYDGEKIVLRLLTSTNQGLNLELLGYSSRNLKIIQNSILKTHGIILITGPTGSGKTTTLYSILKLLNSPEVNISTIEDPIEYRLEGINQIQVNPKAKITFASGLRSLLRQDPDIVMVGEIRDEETSNISINAALTGHLVLATLHTNDAASTLPRLLDMDVEKFLLAATIELIIAQRLTRSICLKCKKEYPIKKEQLKELGAKFNLNKSFDEIFAELLTNQPEFKDKVSGDSIIFYKGEGCPSCNGSGYKGRAAIAEIIEVNDNIKKLILQSASGKEIEDQAKKDGMVTMFTDGMRKVLNGVTTLEEVLRVMRS